VTSLKVGYARVSTRLSQDPEHQRRELAAMGIAPDRIYIDHGFTGTSTKRPALHQALAALRDGDTLCVTKLDRLGRSVKDLHALADTIKDKGAKLQIGSTVHDPTDPFGMLFFTILAAFAEFEASLVSLRTRDGLETARLKGKLRGRPPKLPPAREKAMVDMVLEDRRTKAEVAEIFGVARSTVGRALARAGVAA
jgi:DNA invertase Pin-like site-specific DNA recombinase